MSFAFTAAINEYVAARQSIREPDQKFHPSAIFGCPRQAIYAYRGTSESNPRDFKSQRTLWLGTQIHEWLQDAIASHPDVLESYSEVHIDIPELNIVGDADVLYRTAAGWELGEVKSIGAFALKYAKELPKPDHKQQAMTYLYALRQYGSVAKKDCKKHRFPSRCPVVSPLGDELSRICFAYIGKDDLGPNEHYVDWEPAFEQELKDKVEYLSSYANDISSLPPRLPFTGKQMDTKDWRCKYCPFMDLCYRRDPDQIDPSEDVW